MLEKIGDISLQINMTQGHSTPHPCIVEANGRRLVFDPNDARHLNEEALAACDTYFKRSYCPGTVNASGYAMKVRPYGLNYRVLPDFANRLFFSYERRYRGMPGAVKYCVKQAARALKLHFEPTVSRLKAPPATNVSPRILYSTRLWDPDLDTIGELTHEERQDRDRINAQRAACVRRLRQEFGPRFTGGLEHTSYAKRVHPDLLVDDPGMTAQRQYLNLVQAHPVCVTSTGLHQSIGWRLGEYVALSRAIITEPLAFRVPDDFTPGTNYVEFRSVDECIEQAVLLLEDPAVAHEMMRANHDYHEACLRPDRLVRARLNEALEA